MNAGAGEGTCFVGVDVGGTKGATVLVDGAGTKLARHWIEHTGDWEGKLADTVLGAIQGVLDESGVGLDRVGGFGVAVSGLVSKDRSTIVRAPTLGESGLDLGGQLAARLGRPVTVVNDANATLAGHARHARDATSRETEVAMLLTLGTGVGGSIMVGDRILVGEHGFASELGHVIVDFTDRRVCKCGACGCVEQFASGRGITELAATTPPPPSSVVHLEGLGATTPYSTRDIVAAASTGDAWAIGLLTMCGTMLGRAIAMLCVALDPTTVIIAGGFGHASREWLLPAALEEMRNCWPFAAERPLPELTMDAIGPYAAASGAALLAAASFHEGQPR